ncbi:MAG: hypothetical protein QOF06_2360 [Solirubrobacterales bacterium]|nr:hypothetical protein [Solirubrobacterales bacterium]
MFELLLEEPLLEGDFLDLLLAFEAVAPLLELRALLFADLGLAFDAFGFDDFDVDLGFDVDRFFGLAFVWAIVPLSSELVP